MDPDTNPHGTPEPYFEDTFMITVSDDSALDQQCVAKGTRVWSCTSSDPCCYEIGQHEKAKASLRAIETIEPGDFVLGHDCRPHEVVRIVHKKSCGSMACVQIMDLPTHVHAPLLNARKKLRNTPSPISGKDGLPAEARSLNAKAGMGLCVVPNHLVLTKPRPRTLGGKLDWSAVPPHHFMYAQRMRHDSTLGERVLWNALRNGQLGITFRRQHPIGPFIADFYSREANLVVEVDGETHRGSEA